MPEGWVATTLEDVLAPLEDGRLVHQGWSPQCQKEASDRDDVWGVLKTTAIQAGAFLPAHNKRLPDKVEPRPLLEVRSGDVLVTCAGPRARCGVACLVRETRPRLMMSGKMYRFRFDGQFIDPRFVEAYLISDLARSAIDQMKTGGSDSGLNLTHSRFRQLQIPLAPRHEQERIVAAIDEALSKLDAGDAALRTVRQRLDRMRDAVLLAALSGRLVPEVATDAPAAKVLADLGVEPVRDDDLPPIPDRWAYARLGDLADVVGGVTKDAKRQDDPGFVNVPYLRVANVQRGYLDLSQVTTIRVAPQKADQLRLLRGDVLFNEGGDRDKLGRGWIWEDQVAACIHQNHVFRGRLRDPRLQPKIVSWWGNSFGKKWFEAHGKQTTNLASLNLTTLKSFPVVVVPVDEQSRIVDEVERQFSFIEACESAVDAGLARSAALRRSVLKAAFAGKLVAQDSADEPASVLLERIRAEREDAGVTPKRPQRARVGPP